jgi:hypothetical protein
VVPVIFSRNTFSHPAAFSWRTCPVSSWAAVETRLCGTTHALLDSRDRGQIALRLFEAKPEPSPERLLALLHRWRDEAVRAGRTITRIALAFEAGRDGFWLARWLEARGVEAHVIHPSSVAVSREHRRAKTDRLDSFSNTRTSIASSTSNEGVKHGRPAGRSEASAARLPRERTGSCCKDVDGRDRTSSAAPPEFLIRKAERLLTGSSLTPRWRKRDSNPRSPR